MRTLREQLMRVKFHRLEACATLLPTPYSLLPTPYSLLPAPYSLLPFL
ncbi:hypothetical protein [Moorena sp. SIO3I8]|nr:hypothetical protein [Moorena sp. SIO3I8]